MSNDYTGAVGPQKRATRDTGNATIIKLSVGSMDNNAYLIADREGRALLIDAAAEWDTIQQTIEQQHLAVPALLTTHRHFDHVGALQEAVETLHPTTYAGREDAEHLPVPAQHGLDDGSTFTVGDLTFAVTALRGHTPGSVAVSFTGDDGWTHLFSGDSLFPGGVGATNRYDYQSFPQLIDDVEQRVFGRFDDRTWVYPGHGDDTTVGAERPHLADWRERGW